MGLLKKVSLGLCSTLIAGSAFAGEFLTLDYGDQIMRARQGEDTLRLKQKLREQYPHIRIRNKQLMSVILVAKSKRGHGQAELKVGQDYSEPQTVDGYPSDFRSSAENSFDRLLFKNPGESSRGRWQIKLQGRHKIHQVVVEVASNAPAMQQVNLQFYGEHLREANTKYLKMALRNQLGMSANNYKLIKVQIESKSKRGGGQVSLSVGSNSTALAEIGGSRDSFHRNGPGTYYTQTLMSPSMNTNGPWQLNFRGNIKLKTVKLFLQPKN